MTPVKPPPLTLSDFPPEKSWVLTPRTEGAPTFARVVSHKEGQIEVQPDDDNVKTSVSLGLLSRLRDEGRTVVKYHLEEPNEDGVKRQKTVKTEKDREREQRKEVEEEVKTDAHEVKPEEQVQEVKVMLQPVHCPQPNLAAPMSEIVKTKVEKDGEASRFPWDVRRNTDEVKEREALRAQWLTEPSGRPRAVFRKQPTAGHKGAINQTIGGQIKLWNVNNHEDKVVDVTDDSGQTTKHVLIGKGEIWIGADDKYNTWAPSFAGDLGALRHAKAFRERLLAVKEKFGLSSVQTEFHMFRRCTRLQSDLPHSAWHGKDAAGGFLYVGKYRVDEDMPISYIHWNDLPQCTKDKRIFYDFDHAEKNEELAHLRGMSESQIAHLYENEVCTACQADGRGNCQAKGSVSSDGFKVRAPGDPCGHISELMGFEFVSYDENLYKELVRTGAANGCVSLDPNPSAQGLGPL